MIFGNNVSTMPKIPNTFCPAKWDELFVNLDHNLAYSCCKATPTEISVEIEQTLNSQKENLLKGIQDSSCNFCWEAENKGLASRRNRYLLKFDKESFSEYKNSKKPSLVEINLGNECNFQCMYCGPKFSSQWYADIAKKPYKLFNSKFEYAIPIKLQITKDDKFQLIQQYSSNTNRIDIIGGEPFYSKRFYELLELISSNELSITTNLSCNYQQLDKFFQLTEKFKKVRFDVSLDATGEIAEFVRHGLNFKKFDQNLKYVIDNAPSNFELSIKSLMTSLTVLDMENLRSYVDTFLNSNVKWYLFPCISPEFQSFKTLKDEFKSNLITLLAEYEKDTRIIYADTVKSAIIINNFNNTLYNQLKIFVEEFAQRKRITNPFNL